MKLNNLKKIKISKSKRRGRGYGSGKGGHTVGFGQKGQRSRSGFRRERSWIRESKIRSLPKLRGIGKRSTTGKYKKLEEVVINVCDLEKHCKSGEVVDRSFIKDKVINHSKSRGISIKILGRGSLSKKITIKGLKVSKGAAEKIKKVGGKIG